MDDAGMLETIARATRLREGPAGVAAVLRAVYRAGSLRLQDAAREARLPLPVTTAIRRELEKAGILERKHGLSLTEAGRGFVEGTLGLGATHDAACPACAGRGLIIPTALRAAVERLTALIADAPSVDVTLDQCPCTPETAVLRAAHARDRCAQHRRLGVHGHWSNVIDRRCVRDQHGEAIGRVAQRTRNDDAASAAGRAAWVAPRPSSVSKLRPSGVSDRPCLRSSMPAFSSSRPKSRSSPAAAAGPRRGSSSRDPAR